MLRVGVDVGGTFTDMFGSDGTSFYSGKALTTPDNLSEGIINAIEASGLSVADVDVLVHGSTIAINALIQRSYYGWWPRAVYVGSEGFRDTLQVRRGRNQPYGQIDMYGVAPEPLIDRKHRLTIRENTDADGVVVTSPSQESLEKLCDEIRELRPDSIGICLLNSYKNPSNELAVKAALQDAFPDALVCVSTEVAPKFRELGRAVTVATRALLAPILEKYMDEVEKAFAAKGFKGQLLIIKGDGGTCTVDFIKRHPEMLMQSGPAAGVYAGQVIGRLMNEPYCLTQDTGGTSYDVCVIEEGRHVTSLDYQVDFDMPLVIPMTDVQSIGTGGGSIVWLDEGGSLRVGPQSAGAKPGPVCYGRGGTKPTLTDANAILGKVDPTLGGKLQLDVEAAKEAFKELAATLGQDVYEVADGAVRIASANMARANALITTARGRDPRRFLPVVFGGAGGMLACRVTGELGASRAVVVPNAGVASAMGATLMPFSTSADQTHYVDLSVPEPDITGLNAAFDDLRRTVVGDLESQGVDLDDVTTRRELHMRYVGQNYEVLVHDTDEGPYTKEDVARLIDMFNEAHFTVRGINEPSFDVAIVDIRIVGSGSHGALDLPTYPRASNGIAEAERAMRPMYIDGAFADTPVYDFEKLTFGHAIPGPAMIEMRHASVVVEDGWNAKLDEHKNILLEVG